MRLAEYLAEGRVVRIGEASLLGQARLTPDTGRLDLVWVDGSAREGPLHLLVAHYPGEVDGAALREAVGALLPELEVTVPRKNLLPESASIEPVARGWVLDCRLGLPTARLDLAVQLVAAVEEALAGQGLRLRRIDRTERLRARDETEPEGRRSTRERFLRWRLPWERPRPANGSEGLAGADEVALFVSPCRSELPGDSTWRRLLRLRNRGKVQGANPVSGRGAASADGSGARSRPGRRKDAAAGLLELPATVGRAALRLARTQVTGGGPGRGLAFAKDDLVWQELHRRLPADCCLLLDASASMGGRRGETVSAMADYLLRNSRGRVALVTFRGTEGRVLAGFTRSRRTLREALQGLRRGGLTPLAAGLYTGYRLVRERQPRRVQVVLVTDGEPTKGLWSFDSVADALRVAGLYRESRIPLACCGIAANEVLLGRIAEAGGGQFHLLRDFSAPALLTVTRRLLGRIPGGTCGS